MASENNYYKAGVQNMSDSAILDRGKSQLARVSFEGIYKYHKGNSLMFIT